MALKILKHFNHANSQSTMKIRNVFNSAYHRTHAAANKAI